MFSEFHAFELSYTTGNATKSRFSENPNALASDSPDEDGVLRSSISYTAVGFGYRYFVPLNDERTLLFYARPGFISWSMKSKMDVYSTHTGYKTEELELADVDPEFSLSGTAFDFQIGVNARVGDKYSVGWGVFTNSETSGINLNFVTNF